MSFALKLTKGCESLDTVVFFNKLLNFRFQIKILKKYIEIIFFFYIAEPLVRGRVGESCSWDKKGWGKLKLSLELRLGLSWG